MKTSDAGIDLITAHEGLRLDAYPDPGTGGAPWTIGYGHTFGVRQDDSCTEADARDFLRHDLATAEQAVNSLVRVPLTQHEFDALVSFTFNVGVGAFKGSTLLRMLNAADYDGAADQFARWDKADGRVLAGLTKRRADEAALFMEA